MQSACRAVLAHCRSLEAIDRYTKRSENTVVNASSPMETTCFAATADTMAGATEVNSSASASDKTSVQMDISHHTEARDFVSTEDMHSQEEQEESQLSSQLHEATLSAPGSPTMGHTSSQQGEDRGVDGVGAEHTEKEGKISQEVEFLYTSQELGRLDTGNMSVILLHVLLGMVRGQG